MLDVKLFEMKSFLPMPYEEALAPRLKIACYHRAEDLFALPLLVHRLCPSYQLFLRRADGVPAWDIDLLCRV